MPSWASVVNVAAVEQQLTIGTPAGIVTEVRIGIVTPLAMVPVMAGTRSTSTRYLAASTPTVGCPWSSRRMNSTGQPFTPPPSLMCSTASWALLAMFLPTGPIEPVSARMPPSFTGHATSCARASPPDIAAAANPAVAAAARMNDFIVLPSTVIAAGRRLDIAAAGMASFPPLTTESALKIVIQAHFDAQSRSWWAEAEIDEHHALATGAPTLDALLTRIPIVLRDLLADAYPDAQIPYEVVAHQSSILDMRDAA